MGLAAELGYDHRPANRFQRLMQAFGSTRLGAWVFSKTIAVVDRTLFKLSKGRWTAPQILAGLPIIMVTTTGRRSGVPRASPLVGVATGDDLAIIGTNFGQPSTPSWVFNLEADPVARVAHHDREAVVRARAATADERDQIFKAAAAIYPGYDVYQQRLKGRTIRIFVLEPT